MIIKDYIVYGDRNTKDGMGKWKYIVEMFLYMKLHKNSKYNDI